MQEMQEMHFLQAQRSCKRSDPALRRIDADAEKD